MASTGLNAVIQYIRKISGEHSAQWTDGQLLERFIKRQDGTAFAALIQRHGPLVLTVCQRILRNEQDTEDAFQATFLLLIRKARSIRKHESLGSWLYGVAHRLAVRAKARRARRRSLERHVLRTAPGDCLREVVWDDLRLVLDEEVRRLPEPYRAAFILCYMEGKTNEQAARLLGCPPGTVMSRLARARERLRGRLVRRGLGLSAALVATRLSQSAVSAPVPAALTDSIVQAAMALARGQAVATTLSAQAAALVEGMSKAVWFTKANLAAVLLLIATGIGLGVGSRMRTVEAAYAVAETNGLPGSTDKLTTGRQDPERPGADTTVQGDREAEKAVTATLEQSDRNYVEMEGTFWNPNEPIKITAVVSPVSRQAKQSEWNGNWERMQAATGGGNGGRRYQVKLTIFQEDTQKAVWSGHQPVDPEPLARLARSFIPDQRAYTHFDPEATLDFRIPATAVRPGSYRIVLSFLDPDGTEHQFRYGETPKTGRYLVVRSGPLDWKKVLLPSRVTDTRDLLTSATEIANPGRLQFPKDDPGDCQARSVWCLQEFQGRVYVGYGDWDQNRGPIDVWSFGPETAEAKARYPGRYSFTAGAVPHLLFAKEYTVQEESIDRFHVAGGRLFIPGIDGNKANGPDGLVFANLYIREKESWRKLSTLPPGHIYDVTEFDGKLMTSDKLSQDGGLSWKDWAAGEARHGGSELVPLGDALFMLDAEGVSLYRAGKLESHIMESFPGYGYNAPHRSTPFLGGVVYTSHHNWGRAKDPRHPLFFVRDWKEGSQVVEFFRDKVVRDLLSEDRHLYVLTGRSEGKAFLGEIYTTENLRDWLRLAAFPLPAMPSAFARLGGNFYVGLANRGYDSASYCDRGPHHYAYADKASGGIWVVRR